LILVDANLLLYAYHPRAERHEKSRVWLEAVLSGPDLVRFAWLTLWTFLRLARNPRIFDRPLSTSEAEAAISSWLAQPAAGILDPGERHWDILRDLVRDERPPARLSWTRSSPQAAIALAHGATVCTTERVLRAQVDEPSRSERLTEFGPRPVRIGRTTQTMIARYRRQTTGITGAGELVTLSHEIAAAAYDIIV